MRWAYAIAVVIVLATAAGCTTDVVDFALRQRTADAGVLDAGRGTWTCVDTYGNNGTLRCKVCVLDGADATKTSCMNLTCAALTSFPDAGASCKFCAWGTEPCKLCWALGTKVETANTCVPKK